MARQAIPEDRKPIHLSTTHPPIVMSMLEKIIAVSGYTSRSTAIDQCIRAMHAKMFPAYSAPRPVGTKLSDDEVRETVAEKTEREQNEICEALGGIVEERSGGKVCLFNNYHFASIYEQTIPFGHLSKMLVDNQFSPSREAVEKARKASGV